MTFCLPLMLLSLVACAEAQPPAAVEARKVDESSLQPHPKVHRNHVRRASAQYLAAYRRIRWHYDFETAAKLAQETGRPMFVIFCRAGTIDDALTGEPRCAS